MKASCGGGIRMDSREQENLFRWQYFHKTATIGQPALWYSRDDAFVAAIMLFNRIQKGLPGLKSIYDDLSEQPVQKVDIT